MWKRCTVVSLLVGVPVIVGGSADIDVACGGLIETSVTLQEDLSCTGNGLTIAADGIKLDLNGHTLSGAASGIGIDVTGRTNVTVMGGKIANFMTGMRVNTSTAVVIKGVEFRENNDGVDLQAGSRGNTIKDCEFHNQRVRGVMLRGDTHNNDVKDNTFTGDRIGILVNGAIDSTVKDNLFSGHSVAGIRVGPTATGNVIKANAVTSSAVGIDFVPSAAGAAVGNTFVENTLALNTCGLKGSYGGNVFKETVFEGNVADTCP